MNPQTHLRAAKKTLKIVVQKLFCYSCSRHFSTADLFTSHSCSLDTANEFCFEKIKVEEDVKLPGANAGEDVQNVGCSDTTEARSISRANNEKKRKNPPYVGKKSRKRKSIAQRKKWARKKIIKIPCLQHSDLINARCITCVRNFSSLKKFLSHLNKHSTVQNPLISSILQNLSTPPQVKKTKNNFPAKKITTNTNQNQSQPSTVVNPLLNSIHIPAFAFPQNLPVLNSYSLIPENGDNSMGRMTFNTSDNLQFQHQASNTTTESSKIIYPHNINPISISTPAVLSSFFQNPVVKNQIIASISNHFALNLNTTTVPEPMEIGSSSTNGNKSANKNLTEVQMQNSNGNQGQGEGQGQLMEVVVSGEDFEVSPQEVEVPFVESSSTPDVPEPDIEIIPAQMEHYQQITPSIVNQSSSHRSNIPSSPNSLMSKKRRKKIQHACQVAGCQATFLKKGQLKEHQLLVHEFTIVDHKRPDEDVDDGEVEEENGHVKEDDMEEDSKEEPTDPPSWQYGCAAPGCRISFFNADQLNAHIREVHSVPGSASASGLSEDSGQGSGSSSSSIIPRLLLPCPLETCDTVFPTLDKLKHHMMTEHADERKYKCPVPSCKKMFKTKHTLKSHASVHAKDKTILCQICGKRFAHPRYLRNHMVSHNGAKKYKCTHCPCSFKRPDTLKAHLTIHTGIKAFLCSNCGKSFRKNDHLRVHERIHSDVFPFKCSLCPAAYNHNVTLKRHMLTAHGTENSESSGGTVARSTREGESITGGNQPQNQDSSSPNDDVALQVQAQFIAGGVSIINV